MTTIQCKCGSYAINHHLHGRDGSEPDLCDVCYWREKYEVMKQRNNELLSQRNSTGVAIDNAMRGILPDEHPLLNRLQMISAISAHRERNAQLLEKINSATMSKYISIADMLHDIKKIASRAIED